MNNFGRSLVGLATCAALLSGGTAMAAPPPAATSLNKCQDTVRNEGKKFVQNTIAAVGTCLKGAAGDVIKKNVAVSASTSAKCVAQFRKIYDTRGAGKSLEEKLRAKVDAKCVPGNPNVTHNINDITGNAGGSAGVQPINTNNIQTWCKHFGGSGSIATVADWENCMAVSSVASLIGSFNCEAAAAIATQFPRAAEWLAALTTPGANMNAVVPPATDPTKTSDAVTGATNFLALIDPDGDLIPNPRCGGEGVACVPTCCYVEIPPGLVPPPGDLECFEYTGTPAQAAIFKTNCDSGMPFFPGSWPGMFMINNGLGGPCAAGPITGIPCIPGPPGAGNLHILPQDSSCP